MTMRTFLSRLIAQRASLSAALVLVLMLNCTFVMADGSPANTRDTYEMQVARMFGSYTYGGVWHGMEPILLLESELGRRLDIVHWFMNWQHDFDADLIASASAGGRLPMLAWQPHTKTVQAIAAGEHDAYIMSWAEGAAAVGGEIYIRPFPEMNGDWVPWNGDTESFVAAWQRTVTLFREAGAHNVRWVWCPNITDWPRTPENAMERYYPGHDYVDILALDGYNWGDAAQWSDWRSFEDIYAGPYARIADIGPQPIWAAEIASAELGGDKAQWVRDMFSSTAFPRLEALVWFNENKEADWRITSSGLVLEAFRESLSGGTELAERGE